MFSDKYLSSEKNEKLREMIFTFLTSDKVFLNNVDAEDPEVR